MLSCFSSYLVLRATQIIRSKWVQMGPALLASAFCWSCLCRWERRSSHRTVTGWAFYPFPPLLGGPSRSHFHFKVHPKSRVGHHPRLNVHPLDVLCDEGMYKDLSTWKYFLCLNSHLEYLISFEFTNEQSEVAQLCLTLCDPMDYSLPCSSVHGIF